MSRNTTFRSSIFVGRVGIAIRPIVGADITMNAYLNMLGGYRDRVARIALFDIFHHLENKQMKDDTDRPIDFFGIGLLGILFFFENMLMRNKKTGVRELAVYLKEMTGANVNLSDEGYLELAKQLVEAFRPPSGKRNGRSFFNYETGEEERVEYAILKADHWDPEENVQYYTLAEQGLELVFATKEYFSEFQLSISQLVLRKQLEKGEFSGALRQIDEMRISVNTIRDKMAKIKHDIQRNIISDDTYTRYKEIIEDINRRLQQEHDEFRALSEFVRETRSHLNSQHSHTDKEMDALELIVRVDNELAHVHYLHSSLLNESIELKTTAIEAAGESLYYAGVTSFNFDQEIARKMLNAPLPFEVGRQFAVPFMKTKSFDTWSLLTVFESQMIDRPDRHVNHEFLELEEDTIPSETKVTQAVNRLLIGEMMKLVGGREVFELKDVFEMADIDMFGTREFADLWIVMHQLSPLTVSEIAGREEHIFHNGFKDFFGDYETVTVTELDDEISYSGNYVLRNMTLKFDRHDDRQTGGES